MKNIKSNIKLILCGIFALTAFTACDEDGYADYDAGNAPTQKLNGEFWIDISDADGNVYAQHTLHKLYDNNGQLMITDRVGSTETFTGWYTEAVLDFDPANLTFSATNAENTSDGSVVTITEGKILKDAGQSASGNPTDSIYFKAVYDYDPDTVLTFAGTRRTGFEEDEH
ncbi:lipid-binding protein [uncultured Flavobacterium sp.]|uniref:lipid-binding protein n=1 Tax=uncultured Flavobacterium sp. TaxID=165435 RepID=UPI0025F31F98|nr:lipid-binding protein [uncultured Flavobacterium sp.]